MLEQNNEPAIGGSSGPKLSLLDLGVVREGQERGVALNDILERVALAEEAGFDRVFFGEHHLNDGTSGTSPFLLAALALARTRTIGIGTGAVILANYTPLQALEQAYILAATSGGRFTLGLGRARYAHKARRSGHEEPSGPQGNEQYFVDEQNKVLPTVSSSYDDALATLYSIRESGLGAVVSPSPSLDTSPFDDFETVIFGGHSLVSADLAHRYGASLAVHYVDEGVGNLRRHPVVTHFRDKEGARGGVLIAVEVLVVEDDEERERESRLFDQWLAGNKREGLTGRFPTTLTGEGSSSTHGYVVSEGEVRRRIIGGIDEVTQKLRDIAALNSADEVVLIVRASQEELVRRTLLTIASSWR